MPNRRASAVWEGGLKGGKGTFKGESDAISGNYSFSSRFEEGSGSNPEELLAAAHAACVSMALAAQLDREVHAQAWPLDQADVAIAALRAGAVDGAAVLVPSHQVRALPGHA